MVFTVTVKCTETEEFKKMASLLTEMLNDEDISLEIRQLYQDRYNCFLADMRSKAMKGGE